MYYRFFDRYRVFNDRRRRPFPFRIYWENSESSILSIESVDPLLIENGENHKTSRFEIMNRGGHEARLVIRRGQEFFLKLALSRKYDPTVDAISIVFTLDGIPYPKHGHGTLIAIPVLHPNEISEGSWQAIADEIEGNILQIKVTTASDAHIGKWRMELDTKRKDSDGGISFNIDEHFYLIFNPWCKDDLVYLEDEAKRYEYVLEDNGLIWKGSASSFYPTAWSYAQFEKDILDCALYLMTTVGGVRSSSRNDPVIVSRCLSASVNSNDDNGLLVGNWQGEYNNGTSPSAWIGSQKILQEYYKTKKPVRYGQCWVFAGVLTTVCRALGIPCRVITNFTSAHDSESSLSIDIFVDTEGKIMKESGKDIVWNFHVWNEVWMKRLDIGTEYSGWQVIDATPQETSDDTYRCGPASVVAIKSGEVLRNYDVGFIFAEVNADKIYWRYNGPLQPLKLLQKDTESIGQFISTKAVGKMAREDVTENYKYPERTQEERSIMLKVLKQSGHKYSRYYLNEEFNDVKFTFELLDDIMIGQPFSVVLRVQNLSNSVDYQVSIKLRVDAVTYTGRVGGEVKKMVIEDSIEPDSDNLIKMDISWDEYSPKLLDQSAFIVSCLATIQDTNFEYYAKDDFRIKKPSIKIELVKEARVGEELEATATFINPLPIPLKKGYFTINGPGLDHELKLKLSENVEVGCKAKCSFSMVPRSGHQGKQVISAKFHSKELNDVNGFKEVMVRSRIYGNYSR